MIETVSLCVPERTVLAITVGRKKVIFTYANHRFAFGNQCVLDQRFEKRDVVHKGRRIPLF